MHQIDWAAEPSRVIYRVGILDHFSMRGGATSLRSPQEIIMSGPLFDDGWSRPALGCSKK